MRGLYQIIANDEIAPEIFSLKIRAPEIAEAVTPGQFVNVYLNDGAMLLPRPISVADSDRTCITLVYRVVGNGTRILSEMKFSENVEMMGPLGVGFFDYHGSIIDPSEPKNYTSDRKTVYLIGGGLGIPPLLFAARKIKSIMHGSVVIKAFLGFAEDPWYINEFNERCEKVFAISEKNNTTELCGNVIDLLNEKADKIVYDDEGKPDKIISFAPALSCGPKPMLAAAANWCRENNMDIRVSLEERMGCGYGACVACVCKTKLIDDKPTEGPKIDLGDGTTKKKVCVHGPVFWGDEVIWD